MRCVDGKLGDAQCVSRFFTQGVQDQTSETRTNTRAEKQDVILMQKETPLNCLGQKEDEPTHRLAVNNNNPQNKESK